MRAHHPSPAAVCRRKRWPVGTIIEGDEGYGMTRIKITAIGEKSILARVISHAGEPVERNEMPWILYMRRWRKVRSKS